MVRFALQTFAKYLRFRWSALVIVALSTMQAISVSLSLAKFGDTTLGLILLVLFLCAFLLRLCFDFFGTFWKCALHRQQAMQGSLSDEFLAVQPKPEAEQLQLPAEIVLYDGSLQGISFFLLFLGAQIVPLTCVVFILIAIFSLHSFLVGAISFVLLIITESSVIAIFIWLLRRDQRHIIEINNGGLTKRYLGGRFGSIRWEDARLFALITQKDAQTKGLTYELANDKSSVAWREVWKPSPLSDLSLDELNHQIAALNALVVAKKD